MRLSRRRLLESAAVAALGGAGVYELVDQFSSSPKRKVAPVATRTPEQHLIDLGTVQSEGIEVVVPPLHSEVITATVKASNLREAQKELEDALHELDSLYAPNPAGLAVTVAWGLPYFDRYVATQAKLHLPHDRRAEMAALLPAIRFPSDPKATLLEENDVAVLLRSDLRTHIDAARKTLFHDLSLFRMTSIRRGFAGGGFEGGQSLPKKLAVAAGVAGADLIPDTSELFLGFTSTQKAGLGPGLIANHETLGYVDLGSGYFRNGTHMHLSHLTEDLEAWYLNFDFDERVLTAFRPGMENVRQGTQTVAQGPKDVSSVPELLSQFKKTGRFGHSASIQAASRLLHDTVADDGTVYPKGTAVPQRADFNTLDNPFAWTAHPKRDKLSGSPVAGVHFVVFNPSSDDFHRNRLAMDGVLPDGTKLPVPPGTRAQGFNSILTTTHRQNFLVPPRRHRSFPLAEL